MPSTQQRFDPLSQALHWLTAIAVVVAFVLGPEHFGRLMRQGLDPATRSDIVWHETLGVGIFVLTALRLVWVALRPPAPRFELNPWIHRASKATQGLLWLLLLLVPVTAMLALGSEDHPLTLLGGVRVDHMPAIADSAIGRAADWGDVHGLLGDVILWLSGLHAAAAIVHHHVLKDGVLRAMLPGR